jgi:hypothetical protein
MLLGVLSSNMASQLVLNKKDDFLYKILTIS